MDEAKKRDGRFIKAGSPVLKKVALVNFSFKELRETPAVGFDNPDRTIIHRKYHKKALIESIRDPKDFEADLLPDSMRRPVIQPQDFTAEWEEERRRSKQRKKHDDEEFDYQQIAATGPAIDHDPLRAETGMANIPGTTSASEPETNEGGGEKTSGGETHLSDLGAAQTGDPNGDPSAGFQSGLAGAQIPGTQDANPQFEPMDPESAGDRPPIRDYDNVDIVSDAINNLTRHSENDAPPLSSDDPTAIAAGRDDFIPQNVGGPETPQTSPLGEAHEDSTAHDPEAAPAAEYQQRASENLESGPGSPQTQDPEAHKRGFEEGFRHGEEKAEMAARQQATEMFGKVGELVKEFEGLKSQILESAQDNFYELAQAVAESLLKREFKVQPQALADVIRRAVSEAVGDDKIQIKVHPDTFDQLQKLDLEDITSSLVKDSNLEPGDFQLETDMSVVDGKVGKLVGDLMEQANLDLFQEGQTDTDQNEETPEDLQEHDKAG